MTISTVLFDFGGVFTSSPFEAFNLYEREIGVPPDIIRTINSTNPDANAWAQLERSEVDVAEFVELFNAEAAALGHTIDGHSVLGCLSGSLRPTMVKALDVIRETHQVGCLTNNVAPSRPGVSKRPNTDMADVMSRFDVIVESSKVGLRKPDPRIYELACQKLDVAPSEVVYLDDLGINCKPARAMGMKTIKVVSAAQALAELGAILGMELLN